MLHAGQVVQQRFCFTSASVMKRNNKVDSVCPQKLQHCPPRIVFHPNLIGRKYPDKLYQGYQRLSFAQSLVLHVARGVYIKDEFLNILLDPGGPILGLLQGVGLKAMNIL